MRVQTFPQQLLFSTVRIETIPAGGRDSGVGTSFVFGYSVPGKGDALFLVTNKHVVADAAEGRFFFTAEQEGGPAIGQRVDCALGDFATRWYGHEHPGIDVAVMPLVPVLGELERAGRKPFFRAIPTSLIPSTEATQGLDAREEVIFAGYPSGIYDTVNLTPVIRTGTTATPIELDYNGLPCFIIDASVFPGSSGSPVFIYNAGSYSTQGGLAIGTRLLFVGIVARMFYRTDTGRIELTEIPTDTLVSLKTMQMIDLGLVYKARTVVETIESFLRSAGQL
jgi:hypothetical protein